MAADAPAAFFSYCREDSDFALRLAEDLKAAGAVVWIDQLDIDPGQRWDRAVEDALNRCPRMLVVLSPASVQSDNVRDEISFALRKQKTIIPVLHLDCDIPLRLERHQHIDFRADHARGLKTLCRALGVEPLAPAPLSPPVQERKQVAKRARTKQDRAVRKGPVRRERGTIPTVDDRAVTVRELGTLKGHSGAVFGVAVTPDGKQAVSALEGKTLKVWDLGTGSALRTLKGHSHWVFGVAVTADGKRAVSASEDKTLKVWELESGRALRTLKGHSHSILGVAVTPDAKQAVSASEDKTLRVWDLGTGSALCTLKGHTDSVRGVAVTADGKRAVSASQDNTLKVWDLKTGSELRTLEGHSSLVDGVAVTADGKRAVSASWDNTLKVWELETGSALRTLAGHSSWVRGVAVTADGKRVVSASFDKTLKVWELEGGELASFKVGAVLSCCAVCPDGKTILAGDGHGVIHVLRLESA